MGSSAPTWFAVLFHGRVGSTFLIRLLNTNPCVMAFGELFHEAGVGLPLLGERHRIATRFLAQQKDLVQLRLQEPERFLAQFRRTSEQAFRGKACFGFKLSFNQSAEANRNVLIDSSIRKIVLDRQNRLGMFSSYKVAQKTQIWHATSIPEEARSGVKLSEGGAVPRERVVFDPAEFQAFCDRVDNQYAAVRNELHAKRERFLEVEYADLFQGEGAREIEAFLGLSGSLRFAEIGIIKVGTNNPLARFSNEQDVLSYLEQQNRLAWAEPEI